MYMRLGLVTVNTTGGVTRPKFNNNWHVKSDVELKMWYKTLMGHIRTKEYGVYFALQEVFGADMAELVSKEQKIKRPLGLRPLVPAEHTQAGPSRHNDKHEDTVSY